MHKVILLQASLIMGAALLALITVGKVGAYSALAGGIAYWLPNLMFVLRLKRADINGQVSVWMFFAGEFLKIACTVGILVVAARLFEVHWLCMLGGLMAAVQANFFAFLLRL